MTKKLYSVMFLLACAVLARAGTESEPNNFFAAANWTAADSTMNGMISIATDEDYFKSYVSVDGTITFYTSYSGGTPASDFYIYVYDKDGSTIASNNAYNMAASADSFKIQCRRSDSIYVKIKASSDNIAYSFRYTVESYGTNDTAPNDSRQDAVFFPSSDTVRGYIGHIGTIGTDQNDYYKTVLPVEGTLRIFIDKNNTSGSNGSDFYFYAYNSNGTTIGSKYRINTDTGILDTDTLDIYCRASDTVAFRITSDGCYSYAFRYEMLAEGMNDIPPNESLNTAAFFLPADTVRGKIGYISTSGTDENDYYKTVLPVEGTLRIFIDKNNTSNSNGSDFYLYAYNSNGSVIGSKYRINTDTGMLDTDTLDIYCRASDTVAFRITSDGCYSYAFRYEMLAEGMNDIPPNESQNTAAFFLPADTVRGKIGYIATSGTDQNDYYKTVLPVEGTLRIFIDKNNTSSSNGSDFYLYAYNSNGAIIGSKYRINTNTGVLDTDTLDIYCRASDTVAFRITSDGCYSYAFRYEMLTEGMNDILPNESQNTAAFFLPADTVRGKIGYIATSGTDQNDYYKTVLPVEGTLRIFIDKNSTSSSSGSDFYLYAYNSNGSVIGSKYRINTVTGTLPTDTLDIYCRAADTVMFRITSSGCYSYAFRYQMLAEGMSDTLPNESLSAAVPVLPADTVRGKIGYIAASGTDQNDYYLLTSEHLSNMTLYLDFTNTSNTASSDFFFYVLDKTGNTLYNMPYYNAATGQSSDTLPINCLPADSVYFKISSNGCFAYRFTFGLENAEPKATIKYARFGNKFSFSADSIRADELLWVFGDGGASNLSMPVKEFAIGEYDVVLESRSNVCNLTDRDSLHVSVQGIEYYTPHKAGTDIGMGSFIVRFFGGGFNTATEVTLTKNGTVYRPDNIKSASSAVLTAMFNLRGVQTGYYDVKVVLENGSEYSFPNGFEIFNDTADFKFNAQIMGPNNVRTNRWVNYTLSVQNNKSRIANGVSAFIVLPKDVTTNIGEVMYKRSGKITIKGDDYNKLTIDREDYSNLYYNGAFDPYTDTIEVDFDNIYSHFDSLLSYDTDLLFDEPYEGRVYPLYIPAIPGNSSYEISFKLKSGGNGKYNIRTFALPYTTRNNPISGQTLDVIHDAGIQAAAVAELAPNPALKAVGKSAGYVDIGSQVAFTEFFDWWYGTNVGDDDFYKRQALALSGEVAGEMLPFGDKVDNSLDNIKLAKNKLKNTTGHMRMAEDLLLNGNIKHNGIKKKLIDDLYKYRKTIEEYGGDYVTDQQRQALLNSFYHIAAKNGINLTSEELQELLFPDEVNDKTINSVASFDPNAIYGNTGAGDERYILKTEQQNYLVTFENVDTALAPAQIVKVAVDLDTHKYDLRSLVLNDITIAGKTYHFEENRMEYFRDIDLRPAKDMIVRVNAKTDISKGSIRWQFSSLDPATMDLTEDALDGFLPPNANAPEGEGSVSFSVKLKPTLLNLDTISTYATIYFDENEPIITNTWKNTIDDKKPITTLSPIVETDSNVMKLKLAGTDTESGFNNYMLFVKVNDGAWSRSGIPITPYIEHNIIGYFDSTYSFYVTGNDKAGNLEEKQPGAEASLTLRRDDGYTSGDRFSVFPNPNDGILYIMPAGNFEQAGVTITDMAGRQVQSYNIDFIKGERKKLDLGHLSDGIYLISFYPKEAGSESHKIVINKKR